MARLVLRKSRRIPVSRASLRIKRPKRLPGSAKSSVKTGIIALSILVAFIVVGKIIGFIVGLDAPYNSDNPLGGKNINWDGKSVFNIVVKADIHYLLSYDPSVPAILVVKLPDDLYANLPFEFGRWPIRSIYSLGQAEQPPVGAELLKRGLAYHFDIPIDRYLLLNGNFSNFQAVAVVELIRANPLASISMFNTSKTDMSARELWHLVWGIKSIRSDKIKLVDLSQTSITKTVVLSDGSGSLNIDQASLSKFIADNFKDDQLRMEGVNISIHNATTHPQLAEKAARLVTSLGGRVIFTTNAELPLEKSIVVGKDSYTKNRLSQIFAFECFKIVDCGKIICGGEKECPKLSALSANSRADVSLYLGEDFFTSLNDRSSLSPIGY